MAFDVLVEEDGLEGTLATFLVIEVEVDVVVDNLDKLEAAKKEYPQYKELILK